MNSTFAKKVTEVTLGKPILVAATILATIALNISISLWLINVPGNFHQQLEQNIQETFVRYQENLDSRQQFNQMIVQQHEEIAKLYSFTEENSWKRLEALSFNLLNLFNQTNFKEQNSSNNFFKSAKLKREEMLDIVKSSKLADGYKATLNMMILTLEFKQSKFQERINGILKTNLFSQTYDVSVQDKYVSYLNNDNRKNINTILCIFQALWMTFMLVGMYLLPFWRRKEDKINLASYVETLNREIIEEESNETTMSELVDNAIEELSPTFQSKQVFINFTSSSDPSVEMIISEKNAPRVSMAIKNLLRNLCSIVASHESANTINLKLGKKENKFEITGDIPGMFINEDLLQQKHIDENNRLYTLDDSVEKFEETLNDFNCTVILKNSYDDNDNFIFSTINAKFDYLTTIQ